MFSYTLSFLRKKKKEIKKYILKKRKEKEKEKEKKKEIKKKKNKNGK